MSNNHVKKLRVERGLSQIKLAIESGQTSGKISQIERGMRCNQKTARKIATALGVEPTEVFLHFDQLRRW